MYPIMFDWQGIVVPSWHVCFFIAALMALVVLWQLQKCYGGYSRRQMLDLYLICYLSGYFGARLLAIIVERPYQGILSLIGEMFSLGSLVLYGGVILATVTGLIYLRWQRLAVWQLLDHFLLALLLAIAIGRIGCFLNGDDYGIVTDSSLGVIFPNLNDNLPRYPTQLFESIFCLVFFVGSCLVFIKFRQRFAAGTTGLAIAASYAVWRFFCEFLRADYRGWVISEKISTSQFISIVVLVVICVVASGKFKNKRNPFLCR